MMPATIFLVADIRRQARLLSERGAADLGAGSAAKSFVDSLWIRPPVFSFQTPEHRTTPNAVVNRRIFRKKRIVREGIIRIVRNAGWPKVVSYKTK